MSTQKIIKSNIRGIAATTDIPKYHNVQALKEPQKSTDKIIPIIHITINTVQDKIPKIKEKKSKHKVAVPCAKESSSKYTPEKTKKKSGRYDTEKTCLKFPELRGSVLYAKCYCLTRNGLQDNCCLSQCQGQPKCLVKPWAVCPPAKFVRSRFPEMYPT